MAELPLEAYAFSLGLASAPKIPGLAKALSAEYSTVNTGDGGGGTNADGTGGEQNGIEGVEQEREEQRKKKNVNRSLQRLKEQIKAEKLRKRQEVICTKF